VEQANGTYRLVGLRSVKALLSPAHAHAHLHLHHLGFLIENCNNEVAHRQQRKA
jgi:hypothetical protein